MTNNKTFMFDSNIFANFIIKEIDLNILKDKFKYVITHIQKDEIEQTQHPERKKLLLEVFNNISPELIPTEGAVFDFSRFDQCSFASENDNLIEKIADNLPKKSNKTEKEDMENRLRDALIASTCINNGYTLITEDKNLINEIKKYNGDVLNLDDFLSFIKK